jgi:hypothetical protein
VLDLHGNKITARGASGLVKACMGRVGSLVMISNDLDAAFMAGVNGIANERRLVVVV